jgi:hypothetical protein
LIKLEDDALIPRHLWVMAHLRQCHHLGVIATLLHLGDKQQGSLLLKLYAPRRGLNWLLLEVRDAQGRQAWLPALDGGLMDEASAKAYLARALERDRDLWILEIEHEEFWHPFPGKILTEKLGE